MWLSFESCGIIWSPNVIVTACQQEEVQIPYIFNSSPSSAAFMQQWIGSALVQIMACRLFGAKIWSQSVLGTNFNENFIKIQNFSFMKMHIEISSVKWRPWEVNPCPTEVGTIKKYLHFLSYLLPGLVQKFEIIHHAYLMTWVLMH